jgi:hypothetical protein
MSIIKILLRICWYRIVCFYVCSRCLVVINLTICPTYDLLHEKTPTGPIHDKFSSCSQPHTLRKLDSLAQESRHLRNGKGSRMLSSTSLEILIIGVNEECYWNLCLHTVLQIIWIRYKIKQCHCFIDPKPTLLYEANLNCMLAITLLSAVLWQSVPLKIFFSITNTL